MGNREVYDEISGHFSTDTDVQVNSGKGAQGIKYNNKMFIMFWKGDLVIKLSPERILELIKNGEGQAYDPGTGKPMKDRILIVQAKKSQWISLSEESKQYIMQ